MNIKLIGAVFVIFGCGWVGFRMASNHIREENALRQLISALDYMECELQYRYTPLPELCRQAAAQQKGHLRNIFLRLTQELEDQISPDVDRCMQAALFDSKEIPTHTRTMLENLGQSLGRFDMDGQLKGLENVRGECRRLLDNLGKDKEIRIRSYQTLGLCAGAALAILLL